MSSLSRRVFVRRLTGLGAVAAGLAVAGGCIGIAPSRKPALVARVGVLWQDTPPPAYPDRGVWDIFLDELRSQGWIEGQTLTLEYRNAEGHYEQLPTLAAELVRLSVDVLVIYGSPATSQAKQATRSVPIVSFLGTNPVEDGLVPSLAHPGENVTGVTLSGVAFIPKNLELLKNIVPGLARVSFIFNGGRSSVSDAAAARNAATDLGLQLLELDVRTTEQLDGALTSARAWSTGALVIAAEAFLANAYPRIVAFAAHERLPTASAGRSFAQAGGLISYGPDFRSQYRSAADYVDRILRGARPGDLPVQLPKAFEFLVNIRTARALGLTIPGDVAVQVTEWIQ